MNDDLAIKTLRGLALDLPRAAASGHSGTALALAPLGWLLYSRVMRHNPLDSNWPDRDRLVLSNGHACVLLYGLLHLCGYPLSIEDLHGFRKPGTRTPGHPESWVTAGVDCSTGPLGQGLAAAVGMAVAERFLAARLGSEVVDHFTYVVCSDGDLMEGITAEASSWAGHQRLGKLIVCYDDNDVTIDGPTAQSMSEDVCMRYRAYGWHVLEVASGEDLTALDSALEQARLDDRPSFLRIKTVIGFPAPTMQGKPEAHSPPFSVEEIRATKLLMGLDPDLNFQVSPELDGFREGIRQRGAALQAAWQARLEASPSRQQWLDWRERPTTLNWQPPGFSGAVATRVASGRVLNSLAQVVGNLLGGSADLAGSTNTDLENERDCGPLEPLGRNLRYGVREHAMAAITNGLAEHGGVIPFCSTYFSFSDYMKPALRMAALAGLSSIFVWTHDSLALGEDGPTHQPVEHLAALRALPGFVVLRPADAYETIEAWRFALQHRGPVGLVLSRQALPCLKPRGQLWRGAYIVEEASASGTPRVILLGTGSEVHLCLEARLQLEREGVPTRVVSMPSWELFELQDRTYQRETLGSGLRVAVEAAASLGWHRWVGEGVVLGLDRFGSSGPGDRLMADFGFTVDGLVGAVRTALDGQEETCVL